MCEREREGQSELMKNELCESHRCFPGCTARARGHELNLSSGPLRRDLCLNNEDPRQPPSYPFRNSITHEQFCTTVLMKD